MKNKKEEKNAENNISPENTNQTITKEMLEKQKQEQLEMFDTPPAGVYPKTDSKGRIIKYKRRGGVFAFFMGIFASLFLFVFCGGIAASYFYYCYTISDAGKMIGVDLSILGDTKNKTMNELMQLAISYKDGYTEVSVKEAKEKLGFDIEKIVEDNLGIEIEDFYNIEIKVDSVNSGQTTSVGDLKLKEFLKQGNIQKIIEKLLPELYKKIEIEELLNILQFDPETVNLPLTQDEMFYVSLRQFDIGSQTYKLDLTNNKVLKNEIEVATISNNKFTLNSVEYTINTQRTALLYDGGTTQLSFPENSKKALKKLSVYEMLYSVFPNYFGGSEMTVAFLQQAIGKELIPTDNPEFATLLNSNLKTIDIKETLNAVSLRAIEEVFEINFIPQDQEEFDDLLSLKIGTLSASDVVDTLTVGAVLTLVGDSITLPENILFLHTQSFKNQKLKNVLNYIEGLTTKEIIKIEDVEFYDNFKLNGNTFFITNDTITTKNTTAVSQQGNFQHFELFGNTFTIYSNKVFNTTSSQNVSFNATTKQFNFIDSNVYFVSDDETEILDSTKHSLTNPVYIENGFFVLNDFLCKIDKQNNQIVIYAKACDVKNGRFTLNSTLFFVKDTTLENFVAQANIVENLFTLNAVEYRIDSSNNQILVNATSDKASDITRTSTIKLLMFGLRNVQIKSIVDGQYDDMLLSLDGVTLGDLLGEQMTGFLANLKDVSLYDILNQPNIMMDKIKTTTLQDLGIDPSSSPLLENVATLSIGDILDDNNALLNAIKDVELSELGFSSDSPLFSDIASLTIGDILDDSNAILNAVRNKELKVITGSSDGIMSVIGNLTLGNLLDNPEAITNTLKSSTKTLAELLGQYDSFSLTVSDVTTKYYIINGNIYETSDTSTIVATIVGNAFDLDSVTYNIVGNNIQVGGVTKATITRAPTSSLAQAILAMSVGDMFNGDFTTTLKNKVQNVELGDVISVDSSTPALLTALVNNGATIGNIGTKINELTVSEVFGAPTGLVSYLVYNDGTQDISGGNIPLMHLTDATLKDIHNRPLTELCANNVLPSLQGTMFDTTSAAYQGLTPTQKAAVDATTLQTIIDYYIAYIGTLW